MIGKTIKGKSFGGLLKYLLSREKRDTEDARLIGGTIAGRSIAQLTAELNAIRRLRPGLEKAVYHQVLRPPAEEGAALSNSVWTQIAEVHARSMGYSGGQYLVVRHHDHIHIVANRVLPSGEVVCDGLDWQKAEKSVRRIEKHFGLTQVESSHLLESGREERKERALTQAEWSLTARGDRSVRELLQDQLLAVLDRPQTFTDFADRLYERGVLVRPNIQSTERLPGLSFVLASRPDLAFSGTKIGRRFTLGGLQKSGVTYEPNRDREGIERCLERCASLGSQPASKAGKVDEAHHPLSDRRAARKHLEMLGVVVVLAARDRKGRIKELGKVTHRTVGKWRRRLRRRSALGEEILVRPAESGPVFVLPRCGPSHMKILEKVKVAPFLTINATGMNRKDLWFRTTGREDDVKQLRSALHEAGIYPLEGDHQWGALAGYRPDPISKGTSTADHIKNQIGLIVDAVVDVSHDLLERLREIAVRRRQLMDRNEKPIQLGSSRKDKGRSR